MAMDGSVLGAVGLVAGLVAGCWSILNGRRTAQTVRLERAELEKERAEIRLQSREELDGLRRQLEEDWRQRGADLTDQERRLRQREDALEQRAAEVQRGEQEQVAREAALAGREAALDEAAAAHLRALEQVATLSADEARQQLLRRVEEQARQDAANLSRQIEEEARRDADRRARRIVAEAIERCGVDHVTESAVAVVPLTSDEVKGRIIGREGRNIRSFEQLTGVDLVIDDTPEAVVISAFDPIRREVARLALETLVSDGRIHPGRIEDVVERCREQLDEEILAAGEQAVAESGAPGLPVGLVELLGRLRYRTSYGQNVLRHSIEVARLAGVMASELGADAALARRAGLLHDLGKAVSGESDGPHAQVGADLARQHGETAAVVAAIAAHHRDVEPAGLEAQLVLVADALSAARPGARRDSLESYLQRLERLESLAAEFEGVAKAYAIQAGREIRILVRPELVDDAAAADLARAVADRIQTELAYPGQIKVTVIREQRAVEYAV